MMLRRVLVCGSLLLLSGCPSSVERTAGDPAPSPVAGDASAERPAASAAAKPKPMSPATAAKKKAIVQADPTRLKLATVSSDVPLPLTALLGKPPAEVEARLGEPQGKGMMRKSCVRFLPDRVWFECDYAWQRYADKTGNYSAIQVGYEDGISTSVAYEGVKGEGEFDPAKALAAVGVTLPGKPRQTTPAENATLWSWFNSDARLVLDERQYRVEVSAVESKWDRSKVEFLLNHPLSDEQKAKIKKPD